ncbi:MAG: hypothetical protein ACRDG7_17485 [Candidatus Limnocylindria bacterium]
MRMQAFIVESANRPGELAREAESIASRGINLEVICLGLGERGGSAFLAQDEAGVRSALTDAGIGFREVPILTIGLEDRPGEAARTARRLADAGVNIELFAPVDYGAGHKATIAIGVDKLEAARRALADQLTEWMVPAGASAGGSVS